MDLARESDDQVTDLAAIVEGGVHGESDDACSICLEEFSQCDPSTITDCKHQFHLQCILEWCLRSANCPMCWQPVSLNDATSQDLLEDIERERTPKAKRSRNPQAFYHSTVTNVDLHLPADGSEIDLEEHIFQHLAVAASRQSRHHVSRREGQQPGLSSREHHPFLIFSTATTPHDTSASTSQNPIRTESRSNVSTMSPSTLDAQVSPSLSPSQMNEVSIRRVGSGVTSANRPRFLFETRSFASQSSQASRNIAEPSDMQSSESIRSRLNAWSMRYKESISRNTRGWKERLFARNSSMTSLSSEVRREVNSGICGLSRIMERLDSRMNSGSGHASESSQAGRRTETSDGI